MESHGWGTLCSWRYDDEAKIDDIEHSENDLSVDIRHSEKRTVLRD